MYDIHIYVTECQCHIPGVIGSIGECDTKTGQCICKPGVIDRGCTRCVDGTYNLQESNLFGCSGKFIIFLFRNIKFLMQHRIFFIKIVLVISAVP